MFGFPYFVPFCVVSFYFLRFPKRFCLDFSFCFGRKPLRGAACLSALLRASIRFLYLDFVRLLLLFCGDSIFGLLGVCVVSFLLRFPPKAISCGLLNSSFV